MDLPNRRRLTLVFLFAVAAMPASAQFSPFAPGPASFAPLVRMVAPAVVGIAVTEAPGNQQADPARQAPRDARGKSVTPLVPVAQAAGSGFIIGRDGTIVTNNHVIQGAASITVTLDDGEHFPARVIGADELTDLAVIRITAPHPLVPAHWGNSARMQVGDWVLAAGNPFALGNSFTAGIISAAGRNIGDGPFDHFLQIDAPINPGNSGGPAFDMAGAVIGINTAIVSPSGGSVGIGFAIPSNTAAGIIAELAHGGLPRGWLGVAVSDATDGAEITGVEANGPAYHAGLDPADIVFSVDGASIGNSADLIRDIASKAPGTKVKLGVRRNGHILTLPVVVDRRPAQLGE